MEYPVDLGPGELVYTKTTESRKVEIREANGLRWMSFGGQAVQAMMSLDEPGIPIIPYQRSMLLALLYTDSPDSVLNLGMGGGSFERFFARNFPDTEMTSVELNEDVISLAREYFPIPGKVNLVNSDAAAFLANTGSKYDLVMCDLFEQSRHPGVISQQQFYEDASNCLADDGVMVVNTLPASEAGMLEILVAMRASFNWVLMLEIPDFKNILLFCMRKKSPKHDLARHGCEDLLSETGIDLSACLDRIIELPVKMEPNVE